MTGGFVCAGLKVLAAKPQEEWGRGSFPRFFAACYGGSAAKPLYPGVNKTAATQATLKTKGISFPVF